MCEYISMEIDKRISPFASDIAFADVETLLKAFSQKAEAEGWTKKEIDYVVKQASKGNLQSAISVILSYTEIKETDEDGDNFSLFEDTDEDQFKGEEDFEEEDNS